MKFTPEHEQISDTVRKFVANEINPHLPEWEKAGIFPAHAVFKKMGDLGLLGIAKPESVGGLGLDYSYQVMTASGQARAAAVKLASISVSGARVADVDALVIEKGLDTSLLGMTYLGRLSRFEATPTSLILRP